MAASGSGRITPRPDLALDQPFQRSCDLPLLIALCAGWQRSGLSYKLRPGLEHMFHIEKVRMCWHGGLFRSCPNAICSAPIGCRSLRR
jgi:hypothetical protein